MTMLDRLTPPECAAVFVMLLDDDQAAGLLGRLPPDQLATMSQQSYCPAVRQTPVLTDLFNRTPLLPLSESLLGEGNVLPISMTQVALRFPGYGKQHARKVGGHIDGVGTDTNGIPRGQFVRNFSLLATCLLSDLPGDFRGNFTVWPGSHLAGEAFFRKATPEVLKAGGPKYDLPRDPVQITGKAGDVCLSHFQLWHGAAPNQGPDIRYAAIFRVRHIDAEANGTDVMTDIWREFPGVRGAVGETAQTPDLQG